MDNINIDLMDEIPLLSKKTAKQMSNLVVDSLPRNITVSPETIVNIMNHYLVVFINQLTADVIDFNYKYLEEQHKNGSVGLTYDF